jgi:hypothetical protein
MPAHGQIQLCMENQGQMRIIPLIKFDRISSVMNPSAMLSLECLHEQNNFLNNDDREIVL